jgi:hypothetical protein
MKCTTLVGWIVVVAAVFCWGGFANAQDSLNVTQVGLTSYWAGASDLAVQGQYAYVADWEGGLRVVDVTDPAAPVETGFWFSECLPWAVAVQDHYVYVADFVCGLVVLDISNPSLPTVAGQIMTAGGATEDVAISGSYAYALSYEGELNVIDVSDPANPTQIAVCWVHEGPRRMVVAGNYVYVAAMAGGLQIVDISNPAEPTVTSSFDSVGTAQAVAVAGNYAYVSSEDRINVVDVGNAATPVLVSHLHGFGSTDDIDVEGNYLYVPEMGGGVYAYDISNPASIVSADSISHSGGVASVAVAGGYAYFASYGGLWIANVSDPTSMTMEGSYFHPGWCSGFSVASNVAYVTDRYYGLHVVSVADPGSPRELEEVAVYASKVVTSGGYAYAAREGLDSLHVLDLTDPEAPVQVWTGYDPVLTDNMVISNHRWYLAGWSGLAIMDVSDPASPTLTGQIQLHGEAFDAAVAEPYAYIANGTGGLQVVNVADPTAPIVVGQCSTLVGLTGVAVSGNYAYVWAADGRAGVIEVTDPEAPVVAVPLGEWRGVEDWKIAGNYAFLASMGQLRIMDISNPLAPVQVGFHETPGEAMHVDVAGNYAYAVGTFFLGIYDCSAALATGGKVSIAPLNLALHPTYPNPFNAMTRIGYELPNNSQVSLDVFDVLGRRVDEVVSGMQSAGTHEVMFDGSGLGSGVYFVRLKAGGETRSGKMVMVK